MQEKVSLDTSEEIKTSVDEITDKINTEDDLPDEFEDYLLEEKNINRSLISRFLYFLLDDLLCQATE